MTEDVDRLSDRVFTREPELVRVSSDSLTVDQVTQYYVSLDALQKMPAVVKLLRERKPKTAIIFVRTKRGAEKLFDGLQRRGFNVVQLHGDLAQSKRERSLAALRGGHAAVLVATDVAARGIDLQDVELVVNYQTPEEAEAYVHRVGRTARAGKKGDAVTFVSNLQELRSIKSISQRINAEITELKMDLPKIEGDAGGMKLDRFGVPIYLSQGGSGSEGARRERGFGGNRGFRGPRRDFNRGGGGFRRDNRGRREHGGGARGSHGAPHQYRR
jgi:superfamily II DNA/RNA helicase